MLAGSPKLTLLLFKGYQEEDIDILDPKSFLCVLGNLVLDENGIPVEEHKYVFSPEVVQRKVKLYRLSVFIMFLYRLTPSPTLPS